MAERGPKEARLFAVNVDSDADFERVLIVTSNLDAGAVLFKKENGIWWQLGSFTRCASGSQLPDPFVELRQIVWYGTNDLIVHAPGPHGTGVGELRLKIYRVWKGRLYKVFDVVEWAYNLSASESSRITYPGTDSYTSPRVIVVRRSQETQNRRKATCIPYLWDANRFFFVQIPPAQGLCKHE